MEHQRYREDLAKGVNWTTNQKGSTISLQLQVSVTVLYTFCFAYSMLSVIDELCVRRFHFILLVIQFDAGKVLVMDSLRKDSEMWADLKKILQR